MVVKGDGVGGGKDWECGISRRKLLYTGWINNKVLLYSIRNYIQYPVINCNGPLSWWFGLEIQKVRDFPGGAVVKICLLMQERLV